MDIPEKTITEVVKTDKTINCFDVKDIRIKDQKVIIAVRLYMKSPDTPLNPLQTPVTKMDITMKDKDFDAYVKSKLDNTWLNTFITDYLLAL